MSLWHRKKTLDQLLAQRYPDHHAVLEAWQSEEAGKWKDDDLKACMAGHRWPKSLAHPRCPICQMPMKTTL